MALAAAAMGITVDASDILRGGAAVPTGTSTSAVPATGTAVATAPAVTSGQDRLARATQALEAVKQMQNAARNLALTGANNLKAGLPAVPLNSYGVANGLRPALAVPKDLAKPVSGEDASLWTGASLPKVVTAQAANGDTTSTVTITQTQQQAVLNWESFNLGKNTTLAFDQTAGGANVGDWIAFNKIGVTGSPSQILGSIQAAGQVYVINPNGIIFGGSSQVNTHALVASSLPINDNLVQRGLLNNPDAQFLFSALPLAGGVNGTPAYVPVVTDPGFQLTGTGSTYTLARNIAAGRAPAVSYAAAGEAPVALKAAVDYTVGAPGTDGKTTLTFTAAGLAKTKGADITVAYTPAGDQYGNVEVQAGALLTAPTNADHIGGRVALVGPNVSNAGHISTADGQTILAAGLQVGLVPHATADASLRGLDVYVGAVADPAVKTGAAAGVAANERLVGTDGTVTAGLIEAARGDVLLVGKAVNQNGFVNSSTSVSYNGRVDLLADYNAVSNGGDATITKPFLPQATGSVTFGAGSVTQVLPEYASTDRIVGTQLQLPSQVNVEARTITLAADSASGSTVPSALVLVPGGNVNLNAGDWLFTAGGLDATTGALKPSSLQQLVYDSGQVTLAAGAAIDVSGSANVSASVKENIVAVQLRGSELANSPLQRNGVLRGQTVQVDIRQTGTYNGVAWVGTPLADASGYVGLIQRTVGELTTDGGKVTVNAGGAVALKAGSSINVSGGWINYAGGLVETTKLLVGGHIVDIAQATPDRTYEGIYTGTSSTTDPKWGTTQTNTNPLPLGVYESGYIQGGNGGSLQITAPVMTVAGNLLGRTYAGPAQRNAFVAYDSPTLQAVKTAGIDPRVWELASQPKASALLLAFQAQQSTLYNSSYPVYSPKPGDVYIGTPTNPRTVAGLSAPVVLSPDLFRANAVDALGNDVGSFGQVTINNSADNATVSSTGQITPATLYGNIVVSSAVTTLPGAVLTLDAANIDVQAPITAPAGTLAFTAHDYSPQFASTWTNTDVKLGSIAPVYDATRGNLSLGAAAALDVTGLTVDDRLTSASAGTRPAMIAGGKVALSANNITLSAASVIDASGGVAVSPAGKQSFGAGGGITLNAGQDPTFGTITGGALNLNGATLEAYSGTVGGTLSLQAPLIQIGGTQPAGAGALWLQADSQDMVDFFNNGGFSGFSLTGLGRIATDASGAVIRDPAGNALYYPAVAVAAGTVIRPVAKNRLWSNGQPAGLVTLAEGVRAPVSLSLIAKGVTNSFTTNTGFGALVARGDLFVGPGAVIQTDAQTNQARGVTLKGDTVTVLGKIRTPGGTISITGSGKSEDKFNSANRAVVTVDLGPSSVLDASGQALLLPDAYGRSSGDAGYLRTGTVVGGGSINVAGNIVAEGSRQVTDAGGKVSTAPGARFDVSGASAVLDLTATVGGAADVTSTNGRAYLATRVDSSAGQISLRGGEELFSDAVLVGTAGGPTARGGTLTLQSGVFIADTSLVREPTDTTLELTPSGSTLGGFAFSGLTAIGQAVGAAGTVPEHGHLAVSAFSGGGFDQINLNGTVKFSPTTAGKTGETIAISATGGITAGTNGVLNVASGLNVQLTAPHVVIGTPFAAPSPSVVELTDGDASPVPVLPTTGTGTLTISAGSTLVPGLIDIGNLSLQGIGAATFTAVNGDIRGDGTLDLAGRLTLAAGQIYPPTATTFTVGAYDFLDSAGVAQKGQITILPSGGRRQAPLSAAGTLNLNASVISQGGVLLAPFGTINLGSDGTAIDLLTGTGKYGATKQLTLAKGSVTSVSGSDNALLDPVTGAPVAIPYGVEVNGTTWLDPRGADITSLPPPGKSVNLVATAITTEAGSKVDLNGGGDLSAARWIPGTGGTRDILNPQSAAASFAIIPGYSSAFAPYAAFNSSDATVATAQGGIVANQLAGKDPGYVSLDPTTGASRLAVGDNIYLQASAGLPAGYYTLLPARYATLPGAFLVTPKTGVPNGSNVVLPDGSTIVSGYRSNAFSPVPSGLQSLYSNFEVASQKVLNTRAQYDVFFANTAFVPASTTSVGTAPRLPVDGGQLLLAATGAMSLHGAVSATAPATGRGGLVDISSLADISIVGGGTAAPSTGLVLDSSELATFGAASLLIGGYRQTGTNGTIVKVVTNNLTVDNAGSALAGADLMLVAGKNLSVKAGSEIDAVGTATGSSQAVALGDPAVAGSGTGAFLRVSNDANAQMTRSPFASTSSPTLTVEAATLKGAGVILDSNGTTSLVPETKLAAGAISLGGQRVSLLFPTYTSALQTSPGLVLSGGVLQNLQSAQALSLRSYSTIDFYGTGTLGAAANTSVALHSPEIRGFGQGADGTVVVAAKTIVLDNGSGGTPPTPLIPATPAGSLLFDAAVIKLGSNPIQTGTNTWQYAPGYISQFANVTLKAAQGVVVQTQALPASATGATVTGQDTAGLQVGTLPTANPVPANPPLTNLEIITPVITAGTLANGTVAASGAVKLSSSPAGAATVDTGGVGATLRITGASIDDSTNIVLSSGALSLEASGKDPLGRDLVINGAIDVAGRSHVNGDVTTYTDGGDATLISDHGSVTLAAGSAITVAATRVGGAAGNLAIGATEGLVTLAPTAGLHGEGGTDGLGGADGAQGGGFRLDVGALPATATTDATLNAAGFTRSRSYRVRTGDVSVDGLVTTHAYDLSADQGDITVGAGTLIDAAGRAIDSSGAYVTAADAAGRLNAGTWVLDKSSGTYFDKATGKAIRGGLGGTIDLAARGSVTLQGNGAKGAVLTTAATFFDPAGKGGAVSLETRGGETRTPGGIYGYDQAKAIDVQAGSLIDLSVFAAPTRPDQSAGTLHLRAPQVLDAAGNPVDLQIKPIAGAVRAPAGIVVEGFRVFDLTATGGVITDATSGSGSQPSGGSITDAALNVQASVQDNGALFAGGLLSSGGSAAGHTAAMTARLAAGSADPALAGLLHVRPGAEIVNRTGDLVLNSVWDFAAGVTHKLDVEGNPVVDPKTGVAVLDTSAMAYRFGSKLEPGMLTLRAAGNVDFKFDSNTGALGSLSDGFAGFDGFTNYSLWTAVMLPAGVKSWSYRLVAGADLGAADFRRVKSLGQLPAGSGSLRLGVGVAALPSRPLANDAVSIVPDFYQTIRTGTGDIDISAGRDVKLLNPLGTIYTAGTQAPALAGFDAPALSDASGSPASPAYSYGGGNVTIVAQGDIAHQTGTGAADSSRELPSNWLYRRGWVDPVTGTFGSVLGDGIVDSTSWWVDYTNFFEGVGALGGGNVRLQAGHDISNVDAVAPTNARMTKQLTSLDETGKTVVDTKLADQVLVELGGGNVAVRAGHDISGGAYYVERGQGTLAAGNSIHSNSTRAVLTPVGAAASPALVQNSALWLPTALFLGQGSFDVAARGDVLLGPVTNPFLLPQGAGNLYNQKTLFSTYSPEAALNVFSLGGAVTLKDSPNGAASLANWFNMMYSPANAASYASLSQPWLALVETGNVTFSFSAAFNLMPANLTATAYSGDVNLVGGLTLAPARRGNLSLLAAGSVNGLQVNDANTKSSSWGSSVINLSDADPARLPSAANPLSFPVSAVAQNRLWSGTTSVASNLQVLFAESGSSQGAYGVLQTQQALHAPGLLHAGDTSPARIYAGTGSVSGLTLFSGKATRVVAGQDVTDVALYVQNVSAADATVVQAGRDIIAYDTASPLRLAAQAAGNALLTGSAGNARSGDIQISGPGTLEVLAGRNLDLGVGPVAPDGTSVGITSVGNARNPYLPFGGADIVAAAGLGASGSTPGLPGAGPNFAAFTAQFLDPATAGDAAARYLPELATMLGLLDEKGALTDLGRSLGLKDSTRGEPASLWAALSQLGGAPGAGASADLIGRLATDAFLLVLRDAGRDRNNPASAGYRTYAAGYKAIKALFPGSQTDTGTASGAWKGDISLATRLIETKNGGNIAILAPGGQVTVGRPTDPQKSDQGILTAHGGDIGIFASGSVNVGTSRIFTLRGGNEVIWSTAGNIAAGSGSKTVLAAPPTRVLINPQSANVQNDLAGLATGSGIGVLATLSGVKAGDVDLIAPVGTVDAGDAGIRSSGNLNIAAQIVLNSSNIQVGGSSAGTPPPPPAPNLGSLSAASTASAGAASTATDVAKQGSAAGQVTELPSLISVEVLGYGGDDEDDAEKKNRTRVVAEPPSP